MCLYKNCKDKESPREGYCILCGKEFCKACVDEKNPRMHLDCSRRNSLPLSKPERRALKP